MSSMRDFMVVVESFGGKKALMEDAASDADYWTPKEVLHFAKYAQKRSFKTAEEARGFVFDRLVYWEKSYGYLFGERGLASLRQIADSAPLYMSGKSFKIGKRIRAAKPKPWEGVEVTRPSLWPLTDSGILNPFDGYKVLGIKMLSVSSLTMTEDHSFTGDGRETVDRYAGRIMDDKTFPAIIVDTDGVILDAPSFRAVRDVLKWKRIPSLVVKIG